MGVCNKCGNRRGKAMYAASPELTYMPVRRIRCPRCKDNLLHAGYILFDSLEEAQAAYITKALL
jgi:hypothetical protein